MPVPTSPMNHRPRPAARLPSMLRTNAATGRTHVGAEARHRRPVERHAAVLARDHRRAAAASGRAARAPRGTRTRPRRPTSSSTKPSPPQRGQRHSSTSPRRLSPARCGSAAPHRRPAGPRPALHDRPLDARDVRELREPRQERQLDVRARGPVAVLGDVDLGDALLLGRLGVVVLVAVDEHHEVGVLLDLAALAQVRQQRALVRALLGRAVELRDRDDRHLQLARQDLQPAAHLADLLDAAVGATGRRASAAGSRRSRGRARRGPG